MPTPVASENLSRLRTLVTPTPSVAPVGSKQRSLPIFGHCVEHYLREVSYLPRELPFGDGVVELTRDYDKQAQEWVAIALCLEHAPRPDVDDVSGKCIVSAMRWFMREYPESEDVAPAVGALSCMPAYQP